MGKLNESFNLKEAKKMIAERTKDFEKRITTAKNDFERLLVYRDMFKILNEEIFAVANLIEKLISQGEESLASDILELEKSRSGLIELLKLIRIEILSIYDNAFNIQEAMIRSFTLKERIFSGNIDECHNGLFKVS